MKKLFTLLIVLFLWAGSSWGQTTLISPTGDGGFETGATFALNGWTVVNYAATTNSNWLVSSSSLTNGTYTFAPTGTNAGFISNNNGTNWQYNTLPVISAVHLYRDVTFPAGETVLPLSFRWNSGGESTWDILYVYLCPTTLTPVTGSPSSSTSGVTWTGTGTATLLGSYNLLSAGAGTTSSVYIPAAVAGNASTSSTMRLVFTWKNDGGGGTEPPVAIDDISLTSSVPPPALTGIKTIDPAGSGVNNYTTFASAVSALNIAGVGAGGVTFNVADGATFNETPLTITATGTVANPIVFQQSGSGTRPIVNLTGTSGSLDAAFKLSGSDYITFSGLNIQDAGTTSSNYTELGFYLLGGATDGCKSNTVINCLIDLNRSNTSSRGVYLSSIASAATGANSSNKFYNNTIQDAYNGYYFLGSSTAFDDANEVNNQLGGISLIDNIGNNLSTSVYGIYIGYQTNLTIAHTTLSNFTGSSSIYGIYESLGSTNTVNYFANEIKTITGTSTSSTIYGLYITTGTTHNVYSNLVHGIVNPYTVYGISIIAGTTNNVYKNSVYDINYSGTSSLIAYGLSISGGTTNNVYNNFVYDIRALSSTGTPGVRGMNISGGTTDNVSFNTVYLNYVATSTANQSAAIYLTTGPTSAVLKNNIAVNRVTVGSGATSKAAALWRTSTTLTTFATASNNNLYYAGTPSTKNLVYYDGTNSDQTLAAYKARVTPRDALAVSENPPFASAVSPYNVHLAAGTPTQCESGGVTVATPVAITDDYDGETRNVTTPDIGADEGAFTPLDLSPPSIVYTALTPTTSFAARTLNVTITDLSGVGTAGNQPVLYWKINSAATYTGPVAPSSIVGSVYSFTFGSGVVAGDIVSYFVVAQDATSPTPNIGSYPTGATVTASPPLATAGPTTPSSYLILGFLCGDKTVGISGDYATLTAAVTAINSNELCGPLTLRLLDATYPTETFPLTIQANNGSSVTNTITIKPNTGVTTVITGSANPGLIQLNGCDYVTIDGSNSGGTDKSLTIQNTYSTSLSAAIILFNNGTGATNNTIKNCIVKGASTTVTTTYGIFLNANGGLYDNTTIQNNTILNAYYGMQFVGVATGITTGGLIKGNTFGSVTDAESIGNIGLTMSNLDGVIVSNNTIKNIKVGNNPKGLNIGTNVLNSTVDANTITGIVYTGTGGYGGKGIAINTGSVTSSLVISNNSISNILGDGWSSFATDAIVGIHLTGTTGKVKIYNNSINLTGNCNYNITTVCAGLYVVATAENIDVLDNIFANAINNTVGAGKSYAIYSDAANTAFTNIDYNDYFVSGAEGVLGYIAAADKATLLAWQTATGQDSHSISGDPLFTSSTDLHIPTIAISPVSNAGVSLADVTKDIDGDVRSATTPDIGADEYTYAPPSVVDPTGVAANLINPSQIDIAFVPNSNSNNVVILWNLTGTFTDPSGTPPAIGAAFAGGTVLSNGIVSPVAHTSLSASTTYYYKAFSYDGSIYSSGVAVNAITPCGVSTLPFGENFDGASIPLCWTQTSDLSNRWTLSTTSAAGGSANEMKATYVSGTGVSRLITPALNTFGVSKILLSFNQFFDDYDLGIVYKVQSSADGVTWTDEAWYNESGAGNTGPGVVSTSVVNNLGATTYIAWVLDGDHFQLDYWYIDNVSIDLQPAIDLALTSMTQTAASLAPTLGTGNSFSVSVNHHSKNPLSTLESTGNFAQATNVNNTVLLNDPPSTGGSSKYPSVPVTIDALVTNNGYNASSAYSLGWAVDGVSQTTYTGPSILPDGGTHNASLIYSPVSRGTFIATGTVSTTDDAIAANDNSSLRLRVYPDVFTRGIYDNGTNVVETFVGWNSPTSPMKAGVRYTATTNTKLAGVDFIYSAEGATDNNVYVQVRAAGATTLAPGTVLYSKSFNTAAYLPSSGDYITLPFGDDAPFIAAGSDYWITIKTPMGVLYPGGCQATGITTGRSFYESNTDTTLWNALVITSEYAWIMRSINVAVDIPTVSTDAVTNIVGATATGGGNVKTDGGLTVTARGVCWSLSADPTISDPKTTDGSGLGLFTSSITGLTLGQTYHVRAYATNAFGTGYGEDVTFSTVSIPSVTFNVDMTTDAEFTPGVDSVYLTGDFPGASWVTPGDPGSILMTQVGVTLTYTATLALPAGTYNYKYFQGSGWDGGEWGGNPNRSVSISGDATINNIWGRFITWANLQSPASDTITEGGEFNVYAQAYVPYATAAMGPTTGLTCEIGISLINNNPNILSDWHTWIPATFNTQIGNNDEYSANIATGLAAGTYYYASRFKLDDGSYVYGGYNGGFWGGTNVSGVLTVEAAPTTKTLNVKLYLEGLYAGAGVMNPSYDEFGLHFAAGVADVVTLELRNSTTGVLEYSLTDVDLSTSGDVTATVPASYSGDYYIYVKHRNSIATSSSNFVSFASGSVISYDFTTSVSQAYGDNMKDMGGVFAIFCGDVDQDGGVGTLDLGLVDNQSAIAGAGYMPEDVDGDGGIGTLDMGLIDNNSAVAVGSYLPFGGKKHFNKK
ncbi:MAG: hypothetical protein ACOYMF_14840 [Bacteroidales bacterium]